MTGDGDAQSSGAPVPVERRARHAAVIWSLFVVVGSVADPMAVLEGVGTSSAVGGGEVGGTGVFVVAHLAAYGILAWLLLDCRSSDGRGLQAVIGAVVVAATVGVGVELLQRLVAARTASAVDALVNTVGATVGAGVRAVLGTRSR